MQKFSNAAAIERKIGYVFRDKALLQTCFTHSSYSNRFGGENNERLEYLGDAALGFLAAELLFERGGSEGEMTKARIRMVSAKPLEEAVRRLGVAEYLLTSGDAGGKAVSSLYEALVAGIYLDGGIEQARAFVARSLPSDLPEPNYKGDLQEFLQGAHLERAQYTVLSQTGEAHAPQFTVRAAAAGKEAFGAGKSVREAEKAAAKELLAILKNRGEDRL